MSSSVMIAWKQDWHENSQNNQNGASKHFETVWNRVRVNAASIKSDPSPVTVVSLKIPTL